MDTAYVKSSPVKSALLAVFVFPVMAMIVGGFIFFTRGILTDGWGTKGTPSEEIPIWVWPLLLAWAILAVVIFYRWCRWFIWQIFDSKPRLTLDSEGLEDKLLGVGRIEWDDITNVVLAIQGMARNIDIYVSDRDKYIERKGALSAWIYKITHMFGDDKIRMYALNFDRSADEVADLIVQYRNANAKLHS
jgi:hypothetical protein